MNCKPGDMAMVVRTLCTKENLGRVCRVVRPAVVGEILSGIRYLNPQSMGMVWVVEGNLLWLCESGIVKEVPLRAMADEYLRPLRDPGEDARDETLNWLPLKDEA